MRNIKTYEGFIDFFKKKKTKDFPPVSISEIEECFYDISDSDKIKSKLNGHQTSLHWTPRKDVVFKRNNSLSLASDHEDFIDDFIHIYMTPRYDEISKKFDIRDNMLSTSFSYSPEDISDDEVTEIVSDCESKLKMYGCDVSYFIGWGRDEDSFNSCGTSHKEFTDFHKMILPFSKKSKDLVRNIVIKIIPSSKIKYDI